jgi:Ser/Thr protein kinase RdoA (MazF antagonist)
VICDRELRAALQRALGGRVVVGLDRRPSAYRTSCALEEVDVELDDGERIELMFKDLARAGLTAQARAAKPRFLYDPLREIELYRDVLDGARLGTARFHGAVPERRWLFLERVRGFELYQVGERATWEHVARRLAGLHARLAPLAGRAPRAIRYGAAWYRRWPQRALRFAVGRGEQDAGEVIAGLAERYEPVVERLMALPTTVIHGEFYASNVLVDDPVQPHRVAPVDWEQAGIGPGIVDLAALTAGGWDDDARDAIAAAYREASTDASSDDEFAAGLEACRLHVAFQWLGWSQDWSAPQEHRQDWLAEARRAAARLAGACR